MSFINWNSGGHITPKSLRAMDDELTYAMQKFEFIPGEKDSNNNEFFNSSSNYANANAFKLLDATMEQYLGYIICVLDSIDRLAVGDSMSLQTQMGTYYDFGTIRSLDPSTNQIVVNWGTLPIDLDINNVNDHDTIHGNFVWCTAKPDAGTTRIMNQFTHVEGHNNQAHLYVAHAEGMDTRAFGKYSHAQNRGTKAYFCATACGQNTTALGHQSFSEGFNTLASGNMSHAAGYATTASGVAAFSAGRLSEALADYSMAMGYGVKTIGKYQFAVGSFNNPTDNALFMVGAGGNDESRNNAFTVFRDGSATLRATGPFSGSVVTRSFIETKLKEPAFGTNTYATGQYSTAMGVNNRAENVGSLVAGVGNTSNRSWQTLIGSYNEIKEGTIFQVGNGGADGDRRSSAFIVYAQADTANEKTGYAEVQHQGTTPQSVVQKQYVDDNFVKTDSITSDITRWNQYDYADGFDDETVEQLLKYRIISATVQIYDKYGPDYIPLLFFKWSDRTYKSTSISIDNSTVFHVDLYIDANNKPDFTLSDGQTATVNYWSTITGIC